MLRPSLNPSLPSGKSSGLGLRRWISVPIAPSKSKTRFLAASRNGSGNNSKCQPKEFKTFVNSGQHHLTYIMQRNYRSAIGRTGSPLGIVRNDSPEMEYSCMACGANHKARECPRCGSKIKRVEML